LPNPQLFWIARLRKRRAGSHLARESYARSLAGRPARMIAGLVAAAMSGIRSIPEAFAQRVSTSGLQHSVSLASGGRCTPIGMHTDRNWAECYLEISRPLTPKDFCSRPRARRILSPARRVEFDLKCDYLVPKIGPSYEPRIGALPVV